MTMWFWYALASSVFAAISVVINKRVLKDVPSSLVTWTITVLPIPIIILCTFFWKIPQWNLMFLFACVGSSLFFVLSKTISLRSIRSGSLSQLYPLTSFGVILTNIWGIIFWHEQITFLAILGSVGVVVGAYILNAEGARTDLLKPFKILFTNYDAKWFIIAVFLASFVGQFDKLALINTQPQSSLFTLLGENIVIALFLTPYIHVKNDKWLHILKRSFWWLALGGILYVANVILTFMAFLDGTIALTMVIKQLYLVFIILAGVLIFREKFTWRHGVGVIVMIVGSILVKIA